MFHLGGGELLPSRSFSVMEEEVVTLFNHGSFTNQPLQVLPHSTESDIPECEISVTADLKIGSSDASTKNQMVGFTSTRSRRKRARGRRGRPRADSIVPMIVDSYSSTGLGSIRCEVCGRLFPREKSLQAHRRTHTGERPYKCHFDGCQKSFAQSGQLKTHQRLHTGEKPFICTAAGCGSRFTHANRHCAVHPEAPLKRESTQIVQSKQPLRRQGSQEEHPLYQMMGGRERHESTASTNSVENELPLGVVGGGFRVSGSPQLVSSPLKRPLVESRDQVAACTSHSSSYLTSSTTEHKQLSHTTADSGLGDVSVCGGLLRGPNTPRGNPLLSSVVDGSPLPLPSFPLLSSSLMQAGGGGGGRFGLPLLFSTPVHHAPRASNDTAIADVSSLSFRCDDVASELGMLPLADTPTKLGGYRTPEDSQVIHLAIENEETASGVKASKSLLEQRVLWSPEKTSAPKYKKLLAKRRRMEERERVEKERVGSEVKVERVESEVKVEGEVKVEVEQEAAALALVKLAESPPHPLPVAIGKP